MFKRNLAAVMILAGLGASASVWAQSEQAASNADIVPDGKWVGGYYDDWSYWRHLPADNEPCKSDIQLAACKPGAKHVLMPAPQQTPSFVTYAFLSIANSHDSASQQAYGEVTYGQGKVKGIQGINNLANGTVYSLDNALEANYNDQVKDAVKAIKKSSRTKLLASIGGWSFASQFEYMYEDAKSKGPLDALNPVVRQFVRSTVEYIRDNQLDGIDIDWEYPGFRHGQNPQKPLDNTDIKGEGRFFNLLINSLHSAFNGQYILTLATRVVLGDKTEQHNAITANDSIDWQTIAKEVNWINLMSFDIHGEFDAGASGPQATAQSETDINTIRQNIAVYKALKIPGRKILLGIPAYAREMLIRDKPAKSNDYGYRQSLHYYNYQSDFDAFKSTYYNPSDPYHYNYAYNANPEPYRPAGGMVDFTGVYNYSCFLPLLKQSKADLPSLCPVGLANSSPDNRGNKGANLPDGLTLKYLKKDGDLIAWAYSQKQGSVPMGFTNAPAQTYDAYPVFTLETPATVKYKIDNIVKPEGLGGVWFWTLTNDALIYGQQYGQYSLFNAAYKDLNPSAHQG